jgi:hypothetical protein
MNKRLGSLISNIENNLTITEPENDNYTFKTAYSDLAGKHYLKSKATKRHHFIIDAIFLYISKGNMKKHAAINQALTIFLDVENLDEITVSQFEQSVNYLYSRKNE